MAPVTMGGALDALLDPLALLSILGSLVFLFFLVLLIIGPDDIGEDSGDSPIAEHPDEGAPPRDRGAPSSPAARGRRTS